MKQIYLDHAATTPVDPEVVTAMLPYFTECFGNPASAHGLGARAAEAVEGARAAVGKLVGARADEIVFTSGGTEANNAALKGVAFANRGRGRHIVTSQIEHKSVLEPCAFLESEGFEVTYLGVDRYGQVDPDDVGRTLRKDTILVSIMHANNEVGTLQRIGDIGRIVAGHQAYVHVDAVQTCGHVGIDVDEAHIDLLSLSAHKLCGPKGVGALYVRKGTRLAPLLHGGGQEGGRRASTLNVPGIVGLGKAAELARSLLASESPRLVALRNQLTRALLERIPESQLNGHPTERLAGNVHLSFAGVDGEVLLTQLDRAGIAAATGSACAARGSGPSHVLVALGLTEDMLAGSLRLSLGRQSTAADVEHLIDVLPPIVHKLRTLNELLD